MSTWQEEQKMVDEAVDSFPAEFGLYHTPGRRFKISRSASYYSTHYGCVQVYTYILDEHGKWLAYAKGTPAELRAVMVPLPKEESP